jgi:hypothetical protein
MRGDGRVERLRAHVSGSGGARLTGLQARRGEISVSGSGAIALEAAEEARVHISGSGHVRISDGPRNLTQSISGSGRLSAGKRTYTRRDRD